MKINSERSILVDCDNEGDVKDLPASSRINRWFSLSISIFLVLPAWIICVAWIANRDVLIASRNTLIIHSGLIAMALCCI